MKFKIGQRVWKFEGSRRVYAKDDRGFGPPIYREHFTEWTVDRIEKRSYVFKRNSFEEKLSFDNAERIFYTDEGKEGAIFVHDHRCKITDRIYRIRDASVLRKIAELIGYEIEGMSAGGEG